MSGWKESQALPRGYAQAGFDVAQHGHFKSPGRSGQAADHLPVHAEQSAWHTRRTENVREDHRDVRAPAQRQVLAHRN